MTASQLDRLRAIRTMLAIPDKQTAMTLDEYTDMAESVFLAYHVLDNLIDELEGP